MTNQPALSLLLTVGLIQFWLMPMVAWVLLKGQRDSAARFWFAGTACYAGTASLFVLQTVLPKVALLLISFILVTMMLALIAESLRRELSSSPTPWKWMVSVVIGNAALLVLLQEIAGDNVMRAVQLGILSVFDLGCCYLLLKVSRVKNSRSLILVLIGFLVVVITNLLRVHGYVARGEPPVLLTYTPTSNLGFVANYLSVVLYSFGYWGFVIEKNRVALLNEIAERTRAQASESRAIDREISTLETVRQREDLIAELARMQRAAQAGALSASIAHEINQPLATIRLSVEEALQLARSDGDSGRLDLLLTRIAAENQRAAAIIRTLRDIFRGHQGSAELRTVDQVVREAVGLLERRARGMNVSLLTDLDADITVHISASELDQVILNLVSNALDAVLRQPVDQRVVQVSTRLLDRFVIVQVRDNGPGVSDTVRHQLFDLFATSRADGLGLGLWLSRYIVERHGGTIALDTAAGERGAVFSVQLLRTNDPSAG